MGRRYIAEVADTALSTNLTLTLFITFQILFMGVRLLIVDTNCLHEVFFLCLKSSPKSVHNCCLIELFVALFVLSLPF